MTIWDKRILKTRPQDHIIRLENVTAKYPVADAHRKLAGQTMKVFLNYEHMPVVGINYKESFEIGEIRIPSEYIAKRRRS